MRETARWANTHHDESAKILEKYMKITASPEMKRLPFAETIDCEGAAPSALRRRRSQPRRRRSCGRLLFPGARTCYPRPGMSIIIERADAVTDVIRALIFALDSELAVAYRPEQMHGLTLKSLFEPHVQFFTVCLDDAVVGCGGVAFFDGFAEVKRMFVREPVRGRGVAQALLAHIEAVTRAAGIDLLRLETGVRQPAAIRLYESAGFRPCAAFGPYISMPPAAIETSLYYEKNLLDPG